MIIVILFIQSCKNDESSSNPMDYPGSKTEVNDFTDNSIESLTEIDSTHLKTLSDFIPEGYTILDSLSGDLNGDAASDYILVLKVRNEAKKFEESSIDTPRPILLITANDNGGYNLAAKNDTLILCYACGGVFGDPYEGISIEGNTFSISHYGGSSWRWATTQSYKFDNQKNNWFLIQNSSVSYHASEPETTEESSDLNQDDFGLVPFQFKLHIPSKKELQKISDGDYMIPIEDYFNAFYPSDTPKDSILYQDDFEYAKDWGHEECGYHKMFEQGISYRTNSCGESGGSEYIVIPTENIASVRTLLEILDQNKENKWESRNSYNADGAGCYFDLKQENGKVIISTYCGC